MSRVAKFGQGCLTFLKPEVKKRKEGVRERGGVFVCLSSNFVSFFQKVPGYFGLLRGGVR